MRSLLLAALLLVPVSALAAPPVGEPDFRETCVVELMNLLGNGQPGKVEEFRPAIIDRCDCLARNSDAGRQSDLIFMWGVPRWSRARIERNDSPQFRADMIKVERMSREVAAACDAEEDRGGW